jgi:hypothetical protein
MASQFAAVRGRRPRYNYTAAINAQTPYLPGKYMARKESELLDKRFKLDKEKASAYKAHLREQESLMKQQQAMANKQFRGEKKDASRSQLINLGKLGMEAMFAGKTGGFDFGNLIGKSKAVPTITPNSPGMMVPSTGKPSLLSRATDWFAPNQTLKDITSGGIKGVGKNVMGSLNLGNILTGGGAGAIASNLIFDEDDDWWKKAGVGALAGGAANWMKSGGDIFDSLIGGVSGSLAGLFNFF